jgi:spore maturation protein CgeB
MKIGKKNMEFPKTKYAKTVLLVGDYTWPWYQDACAKSLEKLDCKVTRFGWFRDFYYNKKGQSEPHFHSLFHRIQFRIKWGPVVWRVQRRLLECAKITQPDLVWFYNVQLISVKFVKHLKLSFPQAKFIQYANDNPFSPNANQGLWKNYLESTPYFDIHFSYRLSNFSDYVNLGSNSVNLLRSYFIPEVDFPTKLEEVPVRFRCDVVFAGHYENDGRAELLEAICDAGFKLNLFGGGWNRALSTLSANSPLRKYIPIRPVVGDDYRYAICGAKVALCILSTLNQDTYTRRNFQIPAMKVAMLSQYSDDLASLFESDKEAVFFNSKDELLIKLKQLLSDNDFRLSIADAGYYKVYSSGHSVEERMKYLLNIVNHFENLNL